MPDSVSCASISTTRSRRLIFFCRFVALITWRRLTASGRGDLTGGAEEAQALVGGYAEQAIAIRGDFLEEGERVVDALAEGIGLTVPGGDGSGVFAGVCHGTMNLPL